ncbi:MAG: sigma 54-interacting transcriptional regulator [Candidatus Coatesbacteria bacterium]|nr:sigma 54-interacting transcriptional regulator [Candidatus Coatesbacteria bacterium]
MSEKYKEHIEVILDSIADGVFTVDLEFRITLFNSAAERITGIERDEAIGKPCWEVLQTTVCESACALRETMKTGQPVVCRPICIIDSSGESVPISVSTALLRNERGEVIGGVETFRDLSLVEELKKQVEQRYTFADIISQDKRMLELFDVIPAVAESDSTVLIEGESGTGKELFARAIHSLSPRSEKPLVVVNCGALPDALLESELFGHKKGAFTDAVSDREGRFAAAEGGTLFLDEVGDVSPAMQARLLRVLQERTYEPLGSSQTVKADVRVIAATNRELRELVEGGKFRQDLYYRVNVVNLRLPPLRERLKDIPYLIDHFVTRFNRLKGKNIAGISPEALSILMRFDFPGNVRELENIVEHCFVLCVGRIILPRHLPAYLQPPQPPAGAGPFPGTLRDVEKRLIVEALERNGGNRLATARELGVHKTTLWRKMRRLGLMTDSSDLQP